METLLLGTREGLPYLIFIVLGEQELISLGHEIFLAISVGVVDFCMPESCCLKFFHNFLQNLPLPSVLYLMTTS